MNRPTLVVGGLCLMIGVAAGYGLALMDPDQTVSSPPKESIGRAPPPHEGRESTTDEGPPLHGSSLRPGTARARVEERERDRAGAGSVADWEDAGAPIVFSEMLTTEDRLLVEKLQEELAALRDERRELMGDPVDAPSEQPARFGGGVMAGAVATAMQEERVGGAVEATDCAEYPCIIFGRLEGDEEDMEEIERSPALARYKDDVLTLLFWATTVDDEAEAKMPETGLFALAFYSVDQRAKQGEALDRRIRARVMEYWNTDRPG